MAATTTSTRMTREQQVIHTARATRDARDRLEVELLLAAVEWVRLHPGDQVDTTIEWGMRELEIAGDGAPTIDEGAVPEFALAVGMSTDAGRRYLGDAVELAHRLPRIWRRVVAGEVAVWKARRIAQATASLPPEAATAVDNALYFVAKRCSFAELDRQVEKARTAFDPVETERRRREAAEKRRFTVELGRMTHDGLVHVEGTLGVADAVALEEWVRTKAATLDPALSLDVRRSMAMGMVGEADTNSDGEHQGEAQREVMIFVHTRPGQAMADVDNTRTTTTVEEVREWCQRAGTKVTVRPVIDLNEELHTDSYTPTDVMREQVRLKFRECIFPGCHRPSRPGKRRTRDDDSGDDSRDDAVPDLDHCVEHPRGKTTTSNLFPPCRTHHRLKTFTGWTYAWHPATGITWTSPLGHVYTDDHPDPDDSPATPTPAPSDEDAEGWWGTELEPEEALR